MKDLRTCLVKPIRLGAAVLCTAILTAALAQQFPSLLPTDPQERQAVTAAASVIPPDQATSDIRTLAGEYSYGNGFDRNCTLEISPDGRFLYRKCDCERVVDQAVGTVELQDGRVVLKPNQPRENWPEGTSSVLMPVAWGQRLYLVPSDDMNGFSNQVNRGIEPVSRGSMGSYYLREGDWDRPATGKPNLPDEWKKRLLDQPVTGVVAGKDPLDRWIIDLGKDHGVYDGMELSAWAPNLRRFVTIRVVETGTHTSAVQTVAAPPNAAILGWTVYSRVVPPPAPDTPAPARHVDSGQAVNGKSE